MLRTYHFQQQAGVWHLLQGTAGTLASKQAKESKRGISKAYVHVTAVDVPFFSHSLLLNA